MHFSSHVERIRRSLRLCLSSDKNLMLAKLKQSLLDGKFLLRTDCLDFWINQYNEVDINEIPTTIFGLRETIRHLQLNESKKGSRGVLLDELGCASRDLLTFMKWDDVCLMQSQFRWFFSKSGNFLFKQSDLGIVVLPKNETDKGEVRIAKIDELGERVINCLIN